MSELTCGSVFAAYLARLPRRWRAVRAYDLERAAAFLSSGAAGATALPWQQLGADDGAALRSWIVAAFPPAQANRVLSSVRGLLRSAGAPASVVKRLGRHREGGRGGGLSARGLQALLFVCEKDEGAAGARDGAVVGLMAAAGLGPGQVAALRREDLDAGAGTLWVPTVRGGVRWLVDFSRSATMSLLREWIATVEIREGPLFLCLEQTGALLPSSPLTAGRVGRLLARRGNEAGLGRLRARDLRWTFLAELRRRTAGLAAEPLATYRRGEDGEAFVAFRASDVSGTGRGLKQEPLPEA